MEKMISFSNLIVPLLFLTLFTIFLFKLFSNQASTARRRLPPSPLTLPVIGNLHQLGRFPHRSLEALSKQYGPIIMLRLGQVPALVVSSADIAREIMKTHDVIFSNRPKLSVPEKVLYGPRDIAFSPYGEHWRQVRSICVLHLLSNKKVQSFCRIREEEMSLMIEKIRRSSLSSSPINLSSILVSLTNDIISRVALGRKYSDVEEEGSIKFKSMLKELIELLGALNPGDYIPWMNWINGINGFNARVEKLATRFDEFFEGVVEDHRNRKKGETNLNDSNNEDDLVDILLQVQKENMAGFPIENDTIKAVIFDMFGAGTDTTYTALEWTIAELLRHPKTMEKLQNEVRRVAGSKFKITEDDLDKLPYLKAVIKEGLRLHPPIPLLVPRESTQDSVISGYHIASGTRVIINFWAIGRDSSLWQNPDQFRPERFLDTGIDFRGLNFEYIPFGAGRRGCPGITFAITVNELALAKLMLNFNFALPIGVTEKDFDMSEAPGNGIAKRLPIFVTARPCSS